MRPPLRILGVAPAENGLSWLWTGLDSGSDQAQRVSYRVVAPDGLPQDLTEYDVAVIDADVGTDAARNALAELLNARSSLPILFGIDTSSIATWEPLLRLGAQDLLFRDADQNAEMLRRISRSISQMGLLQATQEAEIRLRTIIENIDDGVLILDHKGSILFANPAAEGLMDRPLDELFGLHVPFDVPDGSDATVELVNALNEPRTLHVKTYPVTWEGLDAHLITLRDVTAEKEIRQQLRRARKSAEEAAAMKSTFLANMSHELRMPLASIIGFAQLIRDDTENPDFIEFAEAIEDSGNRLLTTINAVLEATRLEKHHIDPVLQTVRVDAVVEEVVASLQPLLLGKPVELTCGGEGSPAAEADEDFLVRILNNLIGNSVKFTDRGTIRVTWAVENGYVRLDVSDTGRGISAAFIPELFNEFTQESTGAGRTHEGTGLGLTIVKGLVDLLDGRIEVESSPEEGSCFRVYIPQANEDSA